MFNKRLIETERARLGVADALGVVLASGRARLIVVCSSLPVRGRAAVGPAQAARRVGAVRAKRCERMRRSDRTA